MLGRETRVPDHLTYHVPEQDSSIHEYTSELVEIGQMWYLCHSMYLENLRDLFGLVIMNVSFVSMSIN